MHGRVKKLEDNTFIVVYYRECVEDSDAVIPVSCKLMSGFDHFKDGDSIEFELVEFVQEDGSFSSYAKPYLTINPHIAKVIGTKKESKFKVVLSEHCFGSNAYVNGIDLAETEEGLFDPVAQRDVRGAILLEIMQNMDNIPAYHWKELAELAVQNNPRYEINEEESYHDTCEQCGNWNSSTEYNKK